jgi:HKD family nuclease
VKQVYVVKSHVAFGVLCTLICVGLYGAWKPLPEGLSVSGNEWQVANKDVHLFTDNTFIDSHGVRSSEQQIFAEALRMIRGAREYIVLDMFFFSDFLGSATTSHRQLAHEVSDALLAQKHAHPGMVIHVITDPINTAYGDIEPTHFETLKRAGIPVTITSLKVLRDSNPLYSSFWRTFIQWIPDNGFIRVFPNAFDARQEKLSAVSYLNSLNLKANHRKVLLTDYAHEGSTKRGISVLVTSANPHDGSSAHSNVALRIDKDLWQDVISSEQSVALLSGDEIPNPSEHILRGYAVPPTEAVTVQLLTEGAIEQKVLEQINMQMGGDVVDIAMFYLSDRDVVRALRNAVARGVHVRLLLDPNKDAFGREKNGVPNRQVAHELMRTAKGNIQIRWCDTHGEQCHSKLLLFTRNTEQTLILGSANLTRRNLNNLNLETSVFVKGTPDTHVLKQAHSFFDTQWNNYDSRTYSTDYATYIDESMWRTFMYRFGEFTGMSGY